MTYPETSIHYRGSSLFGGWRLVVVFLPFFLPFFFSSRISVTCVMAEAGDSP
jgi:hypothetical protein